MPTDPSTAPANTTSRRTFLTRAAMGGAAVTAGAVVGPVLVGSSPVGADPKLVDDNDFVYFASPLELAAVQIYQLALDNSVATASTDVTTRLRTLQTDHQQASDALVTLLPTTATPPVAAPGLVSQLTPSVKGAGSPQELYAALALLEDTLSATHLLALQTLDDTSAAKMSAQISASESQNAAVLSVSGGATVISATPQLATTAAGLVAGKVDGAPAPTTTTTAAN